jgi:hypothetical protein
MTAGDAVSARAALREMQGIAGAHDHVRGMVLVGSWARDEATDASDLDVVVLSRTPEALAGNDAWLAPLRGEVIRRKNWGAVEERRVQLPSGLVVEAGVAGTTWARTDPVDDGTAFVVSAGAVPVYDPDGLLKRLLAALDVEAAVPAWLPSQPLGRGGVGG